MSGPEMCPSWDVTMVAPHWDRVQRVSPDKEETRSLSELLQAQRKLLPGAAGCRSQRTGRGAGAERGQGVGG